ncbi:hypothetical protein GYMLUDRAFT_41273 [Collybiopsis luxurians FD-317 M1]|uniref:Uncharacterized protein n=1 Tax=Collybiopsis luxurians FD-317 M1 TaxID=944289 RepID=A0A0D0C4B2_9AGAR|nr:hypothetical protein GYMLUDRAFT_41273 [Collybiopsis luxurians FD-317 M1]
MSSFGAFASSEGADSILLFPAEEALLDEIFGSIDRAMEHPIVLRVFHSETRASKPHLNRFTVFKKIWSLATAERSNFHAFHAANEVYNAKQAYLESNGVLAALVSELNANRKRGQKPSSGMQRQRQTHTQTPCEPSTPKTLSFSPYLNQALLQSSVHHAPAASASYSVAYPPANQPIPPSSHYYMTSGNQAPGTPSPYYDSPPPPSYPMSYSSSDAPVVTEDPAFGVSGSNFASYPSYPDPSSIATWSGNYDLSQYTDAASSIPFADQPDTHANYHVQQHQAPSDFTNGGYPMNTSASHFPSYSNPSYPYDMYGL